MLTTDYADRVTLVRNETRRGSLYNLWNAVNRYCTDPKTVILTLDADDALAGRHVLNRVRAEYDDGADLTVGSMLRLDKEAAYAVDFDKPRSWDSNVWQHLRTFKKYLFDAIDVEDLKVDGEWIDLANEWGIGDYRMWIAPDGADEDGEWYGVWLTDFTADTTVWAGSLKFPYNDGGKTAITSSAYTTLEIYGNRIRPIDIPEWYVTMRRPKGDGVKAAYGDPGVLTVQRPNPELGLPIRLRYSTLPSRRHYRTDWP